MLPKILRANRTFQELFNDIFYFSVAQKFTDFVVFNCLSDRGKVWIENEKNFQLGGFYSPLNSLIFFKNTFLENYDRHGAQTFIVN